MKKIDIKESLFNILLDDYESYKTNKDYQNQFQSGIDFFESMIKFFAVLNISILKTTDEKLFKKVIANNFKDKPSLGNFKDVFIK